MLTQDEADRLLAARKTYRGPKTLTLHPGDTRAFNLVCPDDRTERFTVYLRRERNGIITVGARGMKYTHNLRARSDPILARLCINGTPHTNPDVVDGRKLPRTHLHIYREGLGDTVAIVPDPARFQDLTDPGQVVMDFFAFCRIAPAPLVPPVLF